MVALLSVGNASAQEKSNGSTEMKNQVSNNVKPAMLDFQVKAYTDSMWNAKTEEDAIKWIRRGADVNAKRNISSGVYMGWDIAPIISFEESSNIVFALLEKGANINEQRPDGGTIIFGCLDSTYVRGLIQKGIDVNIKDRNGNTALMEMPNPQIMNLLINAGADVNAKNDKGETALMLAETAEQTAVLIAYGADVNAKAERSLVWIGESKAVAYEGVTALFHADAEQTKLLLAAGADPWIKLKSGERAIDLAQTSEKKEILATAMAKKK